MSKFIEMREVQGRGTAVFAQDDLVPGQLILTEEPLVFISDTDTQKFLSILNHPEIASSFALFSKFQMKSVEDQAKFLTLYGPTHGQSDQLFADQFKTFFDKFCVLQKMQSSNELYETFLRVHSIYKYNTFGIGLKSEDRGLYGIATRFSHSCLPNTSRSFVGNDIELRAVLPVKKGEELTLEYNCDHRTKPTHFRRLRYLATKEFTCHCPRCDALGDDTRQFNCCDVKCEGMHLVCQPISKEPLPGAQAITDLVYTGVEYVEPYLLPCSVCARAASVDYQAEMFAFEARMAELSSQLHHQQHGFVFLTTMSKRLDFNKFKILAQKLDAAKFPVKHASSQRVMDVRAKLADCFLTHMQDLTPSQKEEGAQWCATALHDLLTHYLVVHGQFASYELALAYQQASKSFVPLNVEMALRYAQKAVSVSALALGRGHDYTKQFFDSDLLKLMEKIKSGRSPSYFQNNFTLPLTGLIGACLFCGQSCEGTAFSLMKCSKCKNAEYCSRECQKLHWKFHKGKCDEK